MEREAVSNTGLVRSEVHQMFGHYDGILLGPDEEEILVDNLVGWAEDHSARW